MAISRGESKNRLLGRVRPVFRTYFAHFYTMRLGTSCFYPLRKLIFDLTEHKKDQAELDSALKLFNEHVINYEKSKSRLNTFDVSGFVIDGGLAMTGTNVPLASWIVDKSEKFLTHLGIKSGTIQKLVDELNAMKTDTGLPNAILVARMRNQLKENWFRSKLRDIGF